ncbi:MAG: ATP-dependent DNA helicase RecG [Parasporobacterium sp.]|nr:ATP-dependent DNA helicase RecG [Parasporobacterium sp.]
MKLTELKGIGEKTEKLYEKLGVTSAEDLITLYPRAFESFKPPITIGEIGYNTFAAVRGAFVQGVTQIKIKHMTITKAVFKDETGSSLRVAWFNAPYLKKSLQTDCMYVLRGRISRKFGVLQMEHPQVYKVDEYARIQGQSRPVYPLTKGLSNNAVTRAVEEAFNSQAFQNVLASGILPESVASENDFISRETALRNIHFPQSEELFKEAAGRLSFEEIFQFILAMKRKGIDRKAPTAFVAERDPRTTAFIDRLPFKLTDSQNRVLKEIGEDLKSGFAMNRLLIGDVGSGKTIVALIALMDMAFKGYQGALMAPTEVLAAQHYKTVTELFNSLNVNLNAALLTGSMTALEKKVVYDALEDGRIDIIIGTHALIQAKTKYKNLGLVITDEQHRFGTKQREALSSKSSTPHTLVMSATPIPRTLALILYGNMDVSTIDSMPTGRKPIKNAVVDTGYRDNAYRFIEKEVGKGHQAYVICPMIEYSDGLDACNVEDYKALLQDVYDNRIKVDSLHGNMSSEEKTGVMERFAAGDTDVLVSTTVVEVGVDVPNATVMMVENANRFGLAALHQLRGRVGRSDAQSYCIFVSDSDTEEAKERLNTLAHSNNGFEIATKDLSMRGPGEFNGTRQSGALSFCCFDISRDGDIAMKALSAVQDVLDGKIPLTEEEHKKLLCDSSEIRITL